jgi:hypothetical protein
MKNMKNARDDKGTISVSMVEEALALARARGFEALPLAEAAGIAAPMLASPKSRVSSTQYGALWAGIARALDDEFFGQDSHRMKSGSFIAMTQTALTARNGAQALARAVGFMRLVLDDLGAQIETDAQRVRLRFIEREGARPPAMFAYATYFILIYGLLCWLVGRRIPLIEARFRCAEPPAAHEYRLMFCDDMSFDQADSYVDLSSRRRSRSSRSCATRPAASSSSTAIPARSLRACARCCARCRWPAGPPPTRWRCACTSLKRRCGAG